MGVWLSAGSAEAHFTLVEPDSWLNEDFLGGPQKMGPCGPGGGDDVSPVPESGMVTEFQAGETIMVRWTTTIQHAGYFRISLDADRSAFTEPEFDDPVACTFDMASVTKGPHDNVLMDGIDSNASMQMVTLPNEPCDNCTLQVIQVMKDHGPPNCTYYHCANIKIVGGTPGTGGAGAGGGSGSGGSGSGGSGSGGMGGAGGSGGSGATSGSGGAMMMGMAGSTTPAAGQGGGGAPAIPMNSAGAGGSGMVSSPVTGMPAAGAPAPAPQAGGGDSGGCSTTAGSTAHGAGALLALIALALLPLARRRRPAR